MSNFVHICVILSLYGFFKTLRPSEPYDVKYLIEYKNLTQEAIIHEAYPVATYTWFSTLPFVFLFAGVLRYRPLIYVEGLSIVSLISIMLWGHGIAALQVVEMLYGLSVSCEIAYYTYIYVTVEKKHFRKVTSLIYSATFLGNFGSAIISQLLVSYNVMDLRQLHFLSLGGSSIACLTLMFLPAVVPDTTMNKNDSVVEKFKTGYAGLKKNFIDSYGNTHVLKWSIWWAVEKAGNYQIVTYYKSLLQEVDAEVDEDNIYNGAVQAIQCVLSISLAIGIAHVPINWSKYGQHFLISVALIQGVSLFALANMSSLFPAYALLIIYRTLHQVTVTITSAEIAENINEKSHGLVFGFNVFLAAGLQVILTIAVSSNDGFALNIRDQFVVYSSCNVLLGLSFIFVSVYVSCFKLPVQAARQVSQVSGQV